MKKLMIAFAAVVITGTASFAQTKDAKKCGIVGHFGTHSGTSEVSMTDLSSVNGLVAKDPCDEKKVAVIESYEFTAVVNNKPIAFTGKGNELSAEMKKTLGEVKSGGKVFIDNIKAKMPDGSIKSIPGITLKVK